MYTWEIENFLEDRNYEIKTREEFTELVSKVYSTQIEDVKPLGDNYFRMITNDGGDFTFNVKC